MAEIYGGSVFHSEERFSYYLK